MPNSNGPYSPKSNYEMAWSAAGTDLLQCGHIRLGFAGNCNLIPRFASKRCHNPDFPA